MSHVQVLSGIYPVAQVREPFTAIGYLAERVPLVETLKLKWPYEDEPEVVWSAWAMCDGMCILIIFIIKFLNYHLLPYLGTVYIESIL